MLYNRYLLFLKELDAYKQKLVYFMNVDKDDPELKITMLNLDFDTRIS
jgi:hypothetical protein